MDQAHMTATEPMPVSTLVGAILALQDRPTFSGDYADVHSAFARLKTEFPDELAELVFSRDDVYPYSRRLEMTLSTFLHTEFLHATTRVNPGSSVFEIDPMAPREVREDMQSRFPDKLALVERMAGRFRALCPDPPNARGDRR